MHQDVVDLRAFYYRTRLGRTAQRALQDALRTLWPDTHGLTVVGFGFAAPLLRPFLADARRVMGLMPAQQGVMPWPAGQAEPLRAGRGDALADRRRGDRPADRRPRARDLRAARRAARRDLAGAGAWRARHLHRAQPLGDLGAARHHALRPRAALQLRPARAAAAHHRFAPERHAAALYGPPSHRRFWLQTAPSGSGSGRRFEPKLHGRRLLMEATKQDLRPAALGLQGGGAGPARRARRADAAEARAGGGTRATAGRATAPRRRPGSALRGRARRPELGRRARESPADSKGFRRPGRAYCHAAIPLLSPPRFAGRGVSPADFRSPGSAERRAGGTADDGRGEFVSGAASLTAGVAGRYATALFELAQGAGSVDRVEADLWPSRPPSPRARTCAT
jgi:hypothetical protein